ncbi:MAG TPA: reverse gyrase [Pyrodictium sp.]|nr:reverse gyrase [Pyrodictium sp.]
MVKLQRLIAVYQQLCPNCGGDIDEDRLEQKLPCRKCLADPLDHIRGGKKVVGELLRRVGKLKGYRLIYELETKLEEFQQFFKNVTGNNLWPAQRLWAKRLLQGESFAIVAPTGVGKTTLLEVYALWLAGSHLRTYYVVPTQNLVEQVYNKLLMLAKRANYDLKIVAYISSRRTDKHKVMEAINNADYNILITTSQFMLKYYKLIASTSPELVVVDDVDAVLRSPKSVVKTLTIVGFTEEAVKLAIDIERLRIDALAALAKGRKKQAEKIYERIVELETKLADELLKSSPGQLIIASATGRAYGVHSKAFNRLLGFDVGRMIDTIRDVANFYEVAENPVEKTIELAQRLGKGGIIFVSKSFGDDAIDILLSSLDGVGLKVKLARTPSDLKKFARGELDILVGKASYYGTLVRGVDLPERIKYAIFVGVPVHLQTLEKALYKPQRLIATAFKLFEEDNIKDLVKMVSKLTPSELRLVEKLVKDRSICTDSSNKTKLCEVAEKLLELHSEVIATIYRLKPSVLVLEDGAIVRRPKGYYYLVPDAATYVQASGRTSRLLNGYMTHGISIVIEQLEELVRLLERKIRRYIVGESSIFKRLAIERLDRELEKAELTRSKPSTYGKKFKIETCLIVVESPTKARTIAYFFGKPAKRKIGPLTVYETSFYNPHNNTLYIASIAATRGHLFDLTIENIGVYGVVVDKHRIAPIYSPIKRCLQCERQFASKDLKCPYCGSDNIEDKVGIVNALRKLALETGVVYIATDPDTEGEKIAWDVYLALNAYAEKLLRIELHEITPSELLKALANPRKLNKRLVEAQIVRRIEDRWIGFTLSKHLQSTYEMEWLGAGRVQTPVLGWIVKRYEEWKKQRRYVVKLKLTDTTSVTVYFEDRDEAKSFAEKAAKEVILTPITRRVEEVKPLPPYTTDTLLYDASRYLNLSAEEAMKIAQDLFEMGLITYHRTDSIYVSNAGIGIAVEYLNKKKLGSQLAPRHWGEPGTHEAIRPTKPLDVEELRRAIAVGEIPVTKRLTEKHYKLYKLIFGRFIASQMKPTKLTAIKVLVRVPGAKDVETTVYVGETKNTLLEFYPIVKVDNKLDLSTPTKIKPVQVTMYRASLVKLYTAGEIVAKMKSEGIGRPSTYARTINVLRRHGYIVESKRKKYLVPTKLGINIYTYLTTHYNELVSTQRTRQLYEKMERVEKGEIEPEHLILELLEELSSYQLLAQEVPSTLLDKRHAMV